MLFRSDTNGYQPEMIHMLMDKQMVDYIAIDIKNSFTKYGETAGINQFNQEIIKKSIRYLMTGNINYEFRTTVVKELHTKEDMLAIAKEIEGAKAYFLQGYQESYQVIAPGFHAYSKEEMEEIKDLVKPWIPGVELRGID